MSRHHHDRIDFRAEFGHIDGYRLRYEELIDELRRVLARHRLYLPRTYGVHELYLHMRGHEWLHEVEDGVEVRFAAQEAALEERASG